MTMSSRERLLESALRRLVEAGVDVERAIAGELGPRALYECPCGLTGSYTEIGASRGCSALDCGRAMTLVGPPHETQASPAEFELAAAADCVWAEFDHELRAAEDAMMDAELDRLMPSIDRIGDVEAGIVELDQQLALGRVRP